MSTNKIALFEIQYVYLYLYLLMPDKYSKSIQTSQANRFGAARRSARLTGQTTFDVHPLLPLLCMTAVEVDNIPKMHVWKRKKRKQICDTHATFFIYMDAFFPSVFLSTSLGSVIYRPPTDLKYGEVLYERPFRKKYWNIKLKIRVSK